MPQTIYLKLTAPENLDYVIKAERSKDNMPYVGQWDHSRHKASLEKPDIGHFVVCKADNSKVGYLILEGLTNNNDSIELLRLVVTEKGCGFGKEILRLVKEFVFKEKNTHRLWLAVMDDNPKAKHLYSKDGFMEEGLIRECFKTDSGYKSLIIMSMLKSEYKN